MNCAASIIATRTATTSTGCLAAVVLVALSFMLPACDRDTTESARSQIAQDFDVHECAACGMLLREQPAPRGQVVHKDGTRHFFCSVSDMVTYLAAPSANGRVISNWVETMDAVSAPLSFDTRKTPWISAEDAAYVVDVDKPRVMGAPVLVYSSTGRAERAAKRHKGKSISWTGLQSILTRER